VDHAYRKYWLFITVVFFLAACSTQKQYKTLSFFFDGVPHPGNENKASYTDSLYTVDSLSYSSLNLAQTSFFIHDPYREKHCNACHNRGQMGSFNNSLEDICYQCHPTLLAPQKSEHGPVAAGYCTKCHNPHKSFNENLLIQTGQDLCFSCHIKAEIKETIFHNILEESTCTYCHLPHGSDNTSLLGQGTCYYCHDNFEELYTFTHGPVNIEQCSQCHTSHTSGMKKLLIKDGRELCFQCHDGLLLLGNETHAYIENSDCIECHNPHGGEDRFMFN